MASETQPQLDFNDPHDIAKAPKLHPQVILGRGSMTLEQLVNFNNLTPDQAQDINDAIVAMQYAQEQSVAARAPKIHAATRREHRDKAERAGEAATRIIEQVFDLPNAAQVGSADELSLVSLRAHLRNYDPDASPTKKVTYDRKSWDDVDPRRRASGDY